MVKKTEFIVGLLLLVGSLVNVAADECGPYKVGLRNYPKVWERTGDDLSASTYAGLDRDFFEALANRTGCKLLFQVESQPRLWVQIREGSIDMTGWVIPSAERDPYVVVYPLLTVKPMAITWAKESVRAKDDFLANPTLRAVAVRGSVYGVAYDELLGQLRVQGRVDEVADLETAIRAFTIKRVGLLIAYPWTLQNQPEHLLSELSFSDWAPGSRPNFSGLAISRKKVKEVDKKRILESLREMYRDGSFANMVNRHLPIGSVGFLPVVDTWKPASR